MLKKYSVLVVSVALMTSAFVLGGCVAQTSTTDEVTESLTQDVRPGDVLVGGGSEVNSVGNAKGVRPAPIVVQFNTTADPGFDPKIQVFGNPEPQPWTEPKRGPNSDER